MLCAAKPGIDACTGDSGGPLFLYPNGNGVPVQIGITSWGVACAEAGWPGVYTRVASYASWIKQQAGLFPPPPRPPPPSPSPPPVQPLPRHPPPSPLPPLPPLPEAGVAILAGNDRFSTPQPLACVTPNAAQSLTMVNAQAIAVQCCLRNVHGVEACVRTTNGRRDGCLGGVPPQEFTYSQARRHCHINGFSLCAQSCVDRGCTYNNYPVWTRLPCSLPSPVPPMFLPAPSPLASLFSFATPPPQQTPPPQLSPPSPLSVAQTPLPSGSTPLEPTTAPFPLLPVSLPPSWPPSVPPVMPALVPPLRPPLISPVLPHPQPTLQPPPQSLLQPFRPPLSQPPPWTLNQTALPAPLQSPASAPSEFPRQPPLRPPAQPLDDSPAELALDTKDDADLLDLAVRTAVFATCAIAFVGMLVFSIVSMRCFAAHWACVAQRLGTSRQESTLASGRLAGDTDEPADAEAKRTRSCAGPTAYQRAISSIVEERTFEVTQWSSSRRSDMLFSANI
uniref:Peptidase S1 domain-containing protein n=1 Tax=Chrysotila carterae TaxID=13221 RepID=A0A7S4F5A0_CHRCT